jgi:signal transduction histidine kinase
MSSIVTGVLERLGTEIASSLAEVVLPQQWPVAVGYEPWIEEVWANYVSNAIKYGGNPPRIELGATLPTTGEGQVRFWVRDNGPGLDEEQQAVLFVEFTKLRQLGEGHGLGLSIVKRIVERLGGQVGVDSAVGQGSEFYFTLPVAKELALKQEAG